MNLSKDNRHNIRFSRERRSRRSKLGSERRSRRNRHQRHEASTKTFDDRMEDLKRYKEMHGHANVSIPKDRSLIKFCAQVRHARKNPGKRKRKQLTNEHISSSLRCYWL